MSLWSDAEWLERVLIPLCRDRSFLKQMQGILSETDFKPRGGEGNLEYYWIAQKAFEYWEALSCSNRWDASTRDVGLCYTTSSSYR